ncbi:MAG: Crp/Fnr family transcriptional regulator [Bacteroidales bacterium]
MLQSEKIPGKTEPIPVCNNKCSYCCLNYTDVLSKNFLFRNLNNHDIGTTIKSIHHQTKTYKKNDVLSFAGDEYRQLMILVKGSVSLEITDFEGNVLLVDNITAPGTVSPSLLYGENNTLPYTITAKEDTKILLIPKDALSHLFATNPSVLNNYLDIIANNIQYLSQKLKILGLHSIKGKVAYYLLEQVQKSKADEFIIPHTHQDIADMFGITRPSLSRTIRELNSENIIRSDRNKIKIINKKGLSQYLK